jgi:WD40 repeat protein
MKLHPIELTFIIFLSVPHVSAQQIKELATYTENLDYMPAFALSPDRKVLALAINENQFARYDRRRTVVKLREVSTGKELARFNGLAASVATLVFSSDSKMLAAASEGGLVVWDVATRKEIVRFADSGAHLSFSHDGKELVSGRERQVTRWSLGMKEEIATFKLLVPARGFLMTHDFKTLAVPNYEEIELWDLTTGKIRLILSGHRGVTGIGGFSDDDKSLLTTSSRTVYDGNYEAHWVGEIKVWDTLTGRELHTIKGKFGQAIALALSPNGMLLALNNWPALDSDGELRVLEIPSGIERFKHKIKARAFQHASFVGNERLLVIEHLDKGLKFWEVDLRR